MNASHHSQPDSQHTGQRPRYNEWHAKESHLQVSAYVSFKGDCEAAFKYYEEVLGAKPGLLVRYADSPMADVLPDGWATKIMHGSVSIGGKLLEGADAPADRYEKPQGFSFP